MKSFPLSLLVILLCFAAGVLPGVGIPGVIERGRGPSGV